MRIIFSLVLVGLLFLVPSFVTANEVLVTDWRGETATFTEGSVDSDGVKIQYHTAGEGSLVIFLHGITGPWFDFRHQVVMLSEKYHVVVMSARGTQGSDKPAGHEHYDTARIADDISTLIKYFGADTATLIGQDSGGLHAWYFAMTHPEQTERLISLGSAHPAGLIRELIGKSGDYRGSAFQWGMQENPTAAQDFFERLNSSPALDSSLPADLEQLRQEANAQIEPEAVVGFYKMNWPPRPVTMQSEAFGFTYGNFPPVKAPTLVVFGDMSPFFPPNTLADMWEWVEAPLTIQVIPGLGHGPHREAPEFVTPRVMAWLETGR